jgi:proteic killer suppression protein
MTRAMNRNRVVTNCTVFGMVMPPGNRLEGLTGNWKGLHSIRINDQWRVFFRWEGGNAFDVQIVDYH